MKLIVMKQEHKYYFSLFTSYFLNIVLLFSYLVNLIGMQKGFWRSGSSSKIENEDPCIPIEDQMKMEPFPVVMMTKLGVKSYFQKGKICQMHLSNHVITEMATFD